MLTNRIGLVLCVGVLLSLSTVAQGEPAFPLPIPKNTAIEEMEDFSGALYRAHGSVYQIQDIGWTIRPNGALMVTSFTGYTTSGELFGFAAIGGGRAVNTLSDFTDFVLQYGADSINVDEVTYGTDEIGYVQLTTVIGTIGSTGDPFFHDSSQGAEPCGLHTEETCISSSCGVSCGDWPGCVCNAPGGGGVCSRHTFVYCEGACAVSGYTCNQSVNDCRCVETSPPPPPPPPPPGDPGDPEDPLELQECPSFMSASTTNGNCQPDCFLCFLTQE